MILARADTGVAAVHGFVSVGVANRLVWRGGGRGGGVASTEWLCSEANGRGAGFFLRCILSILELPRSVAVAPPLPLSLLVLVVVGAAAAAAAAAATAALTLVATDDVGSAAAAEPARLPLSLFAAPARIFLSSFTSPLDCLVAAPSPDEASAVCAGHA